MNATPAARTLARRYDALRRLAAQMDRLHPGSGDPWRLAAAEALDAVTADLVGAMSPLPTRPDTRTHARRASR
jgi:hypothetical protein